MHIELDIFSGRPNPHWDLTSQEMKEFLNLFQGLPGSKGEEFVREGLGYRGFIVTEKKGIEGYDEILICGELVVARKGNKTQQFTDKNHVLERWLLQTGKGWLDDNLYQLMSSEIEEK